MNFLRLCRLTNQVGRQLNGSIKTQITCSKIPQISVTITWPALRQFSILQPSQDRSLITQGTNQILKVSRRFKKRKGKSLDQTDDKEEEEEEDDDEDLAGENPLLVDDMLGQEHDGSETIKIEVASLRLDVVAKTVFSMPRSKVEEVFYKGDFYINGKRPGKKSVDVGPGDEIDWVKQVNAEDNRLVDIKRAVILKLPDKTDQMGRMNIQVKRWNYLTIEPYNKKFGQEDY